MHYVYMLQSKSFERQRYARTAGYYGNNVMDSNRV
jgi:hypothetical protein